MSDVTGDEFKSFMNVLAKLKSIVSEPQNLADVIAEQAELEKDFEVILGPVHTYQDLLENSSFFYPSWFHVHTKMAFSVTENKTF